MPESQTARPAAPRVTIIGAGLAGIAMGIRLKQAGIEDFVIHEKSSRVGGTWRDNVYPNLSCDIPAALYQLSFAPSARWQRRHATREEIQAYIEECVERFALAPHIRLRSPVTGMAFDEARGHWNLRIGQDTWTTTPVLISARGGLNRPALPDWPGLDRFGGEVFHSFKWPKDFSASGKRVAVVGTGASSVQIVPALAREAARLSVFQRTPAWILPKPDPVTPTVLRGLRQWMPRWSDGERLLEMALLEPRGYAFSRFPALTALTRQRALAHLRAQITDPDLRAALTPHYTPGSKRLLFSNDFYPTLTQPHVELVNASISGVSETAILTADGREHPIDALVLCTGFAAADIRPGGPLPGRAGADLSERWKTRAEAWRGLMVSGFPNLFLLVGPNAALGHNSISLVIEAQVEFVLQALASLQHRGARWLDVKAATQARFQQELARRFRHSVWHTDSPSWYRNRHGDNVVIWPGSVRALRKGLEKLDPAEFDWG